MWEYFSSHYNPYDDVTKYLNTLGSLGWEIISSTLIDDRTLLVIFKRKLKL